MAVTQARTMPGVLELLPLDQVGFQAMLDAVRRNFERFGFLPIETPVMEFASILLTKEGGETERQVYFVQSTGAIEQGDKPELALRFDLTVPLARYVAEHEHELAFPFRRYQIQRVYRGERPQKGRYREFYQCDIDVIGKDSLPIAYDAEVPAVIHGIFERLDFGSFTIHVNNRKLLRGLLETLGIAADRHAAVLHEVDRLGKQERAEIEARLASEAVGLEPAVATRLLDTLTATTGSRATLDALRRIEQPTEALVEGIGELARVYEGTIALGVPEAVLRLDLSIARGLDYYTGTVYETFLDDHRGLGSICSGGRYENLAGHYTKSKLPGVGISIGVTRLLSAMLEDKQSKTPGVLAAALDRLGATIPQVVILEVEPALAAVYAELATELRAAGLNVEVHGGGDKLGKQLKYADRAGVPLAMLVGSRERDAGIVKLKDLRAAAEHDVPRGELVARVRALLGS
jgi:histidyl-tRNA synthetase